MGGVPRARARGFRGRKAATVLRWSLALGLAFSVGCASSDFGEGSVKTQSSSKQSARKVTTDKGSADQLDFGVSMARRGLWSEALFRFKQANRVNPGDPRTLNNMAVAYEALGQFEQALNHYQEAIREAPTNRDLKKNYSRFVEFYRAFRPEEQTSVEVVE